MGKKIIFSEKQIKDIIKMYEDNSITSIAKKYNCSNQTITRLLEKQNIELRGNRKYFFNNFFTWFYIFFSKTYLGW